MACTRFLESEYPQEKPELAGFHIIPVPLERTVSYGAGARLGPQAILDASFQLEDWDGTSRPGELGFHTQSPVDCEGPVEAVLGRIAERVRQALAWGACPVVLGGEHTVTYGPVMALCEQDRDFGIVHVDAHCDLRAEYEGDPFSHACVLRRIEDDFGLPLAQFATRDYCREERDYRKSRGILHWDAASPLTWTASTAPSCLPRARPRRAASSGTTPCACWKPARRIARSSASTWWSLRPCPACTTPTSRLPSSCTPSWVSPSAACVCRCCYFL